MPVHQSEFRWLPQHDFGPIAASGDLMYDGRFDRLKRLVRLPEGDGSAASVVYLDLDEATDAIIWRDRLPEAVPVASDRGQRHALVARVLFCPVDAVNPDAAVAVAAGPLPEAMGPRPGTVRHRQELPVVPDEALRRLVASRWASLNSSARGGAELAPLIAAALRKPAVPLSVLLPERFSGQPLADGPQVSLLWGLRRVLGPLLADIDGWRWSFSTDEPPHRDNDARHLPHIVFRERHVEGSPPVTLREETLVRPFDPAERESRDDEEARVGALLVAAYRELGAEGLDPILKAIARRCPALGERMKAVLTEPGLAGYLDRRTAPPVPPQTAQQAAPRAPGGNAARVQQYRSEQPPPRPARRPVPAPQPSRPVPEAPAVAESAPEHGNDDLDAWYGRLHEARGTEAFHTALAAVRLLAKLGDAVPSGQRRSALERIAGAGWYLDDIGGGDRRRTAAQLAEVLHPVLRSGLREPAVLAEVDGWVKDPGTPEVVLQALFLICSGAGVRETHALWQILHKSVHRPIPHPEPVAPAPAPTAAQAQPLWDSLAALWETKPRVAAVTAMVIIILEAIVFGVSRLA